MNPIQMERWRRQFDACCDKVSTTPKPLTGIEKHALDTCPILDDIAEEYQREFGQREAGEDGR